MTAKYLIRLDDACDTSNLAKWRAVEKILDSLDVKPIVAVIPENEDQSLSYAAKNPKFWEKVRVWQSKGWAVAMHGLNHVYHPVKRKSLILPFYDRSEFGGLTLDQQREKIKKSLAIFRKNLVEPELWVAPSHSFDVKTLEALKCEVPFRVVSDGIAIKPYSEMGFSFIPQQLWDVCYKKSGVWTVCLHPDTMSFDEIELFASKIKKTEIRENIISIDKVVFSDNPKEISDRIYSFLFWLKHDVKLYLKSLSVFLFK